MTQSVKRVTGYQNDHSTFGGIIYPSDFNTNHANGTIAERITKDYIFDQQCRKNSINKTRI